MTLIYKQGSPKLYTAQETLVREMLAAEGRILFNASDVGTGKTPMSFVFANSMHADRVLWITMASLRVQTLGECLTWYSKSVSPPLVINGAADLSHINKMKYKNKYWMPSPVITSYEMLGGNKHVFDYINSRTWDLIVCDEWHYVRAATLCKTLSYHPPYLPKKYAAIQKILNKHKGKVLLMSATPILKSAADLFTAFYNIAPQLTSILTNDGISTLTDYWEYVDRYCIVKRHPQWGVSVDKIRNHDELKYILKEGGFFFRIKKDDISDDLPEKRYIFFDLPLDINTEEYSEELEKFLALFEDNPDDTGAKKDTAIAIVRRMLGEAIASSKSFYDYLEPYLLSKKPIIIFCYHKNVINLIYEKLKKYKPVVIHGDISQKKREKEVLKFQQGAADILIGQIEATGVGRNLERASDVFFPEIHLLPPLNAQAFGRVDRITQKATKITAHFMRSNNTFHRKLLKIMVDRMKEINKLEILS